MWHHRAEIQLSPAPSREQKAVRSDTQRKSLWQATAVFLAYLFVIVPLQWFSGIYQTELGHHPDEPAHTTTSIMIRDYLRGGIGQSPISFAENYYLHYPKIGFGMWPPVFHTSAGIWMALVGTNQTSLVFWMALQAAMLATLLFAFSRQLFGAMEAFLLGVTLIFLPLIHYGMTLVMVDIFLSVMCLLSMMLLVRFFETEQTRYAALFGLMTALAMLTKGNANCLVLMPPILIVLTGRWEILKKAGLYLAALVVTVLGVPWQVVTYSMIQTSLPVPKINFEYVSSTAYDYGSILYQKVGPVGLPVALAGIVLIAIEVRKHRTTLTTEHYRLAGAVALIMAVVAFHCVAPVPGADERYLTPTMAPMLIAFAFCVKTGLAKLTRVSSGTGSRVVLAAVAVLMLVTSNLRGFPKRPAMGFERVERLLATSKPPAEVTLICSDSEGEGALVVETAWADQRPQRYVLRGSKILSDNLWNLTSYRPLFKTTTELRAYLDKVPVDAVVVDRTKPLWEADRKFLLSALEEAPADWRKSDVVTMSNPTRVIEVYRRNPATRTSSGGRKNIEINLKYTLGRVLMSQ